MALDKNTGLSSSLSCASPTVKGRPKSPLSQRIVSQNYSDLEHEGVIAIVIENIQYDIAQDQMLR